MIETKRIYLLNYIPFFLDSYPHKTYVQYALPIKRNTDTKYRNVCLYDITTKISTPPASKATYKKKYIIPWKGLCLEIEVFQKDLDGLTLMKIRYSQEADTHIFTEFCCIEVTHQKIFSDAMLCGKTYSSLRGLIKQYMGQV